MRKSISVFDTGYDDYMYLDPASRAERDEEREEEEEARDAAEDFEAEAREEAEIFGY